MSNKVALLLVPGHMGYENADEDVAPSELLTYRYFSILRSKLFNLSYGSTCQYPAKRHYLHLDRVFFIYLS